MSLIEFKDYPSTETPLNAENLNHNFNELNKANTYSTEEQVIGTYNGEPLYRKVLVIGKHIFANGDNKFAHGISNLKRAVDIKYSMYFSNASQWYTYWSTIVGKLATSSDVILSTNGSNTFYNLEITIEYTKND